MSDPCGGCDPVVADRLAALPGGGRLNEITDAAIGTRPRSRSP